MALSEADLAERAVASAERPPAYICILEDEPGAGVHLEALLASAPGGTALGEARRLWTEPLDSLACSCGAKASQCGYWREALIRAGMGAPSLKQLAGLEETALSRWRLVGAGFSLARLRARADAKAFFALQGGLFSAIAAVSGARLFIERTTSAERAWAMATRPEARIVRAHGGAGARAKTGVAGRLLPFRTGVASLDASALTADPREELRRALGPGLAGAVDWRGERDFAPDPNRHALNSAADKAATRDRNATPFWAAGAAA